MVGNGKTEEYRDFNMYWGKRFAYSIKTPTGFWTRAPLFKIWDQVLFANGGHFGDVPKKLFEFKGIEIREGNPEWGAVPRKKYFVIKLGSELTLK